VKNSVHPDPHTAEIIKSVSLLVEINRVTDRDVLRNLNHAVIERMRALDRDLVYSFRIGDKVEFDGRRGGTVKGIVEKINARTVTVGVDFGRTWRVGASMLRKSADNDKVTV
jgi:uncharacterized protein YkvS